MKVILSGRGRWSGLALAVLLMGWPLLQAAETETRVFSVQVGDKQAGEYQLIVEDRDGTLTATSHAHVKVKYWLGTYHYCYHGTEAWKDGRLVRLEAASNDNGTRHNVTGTADNSGLVLSIDGNPVTVRPEVWTTTYWQLPAGVQRSQTLALLDVDTGSVNAAKLEYVGATQVQVGGQPWDCSRYRLSGPVAVDLWYDGRGRLVHQESIEEGQRTVLHLTQIQR
jgi:hypothetical protein